MNAGNEDTSEESGDHEAPMIVPQPIDSVRDALTPDKLDLDDVPDAILEPIFPKQGENNDARRE